jgi:hypothetical protein
LTTGSRIAEFRDAVRARDGRCVVSGKVATGAQYGRWWGFEAAHIFPLAYEDHWNRNNYSRWISYHPTTGGSINSVQNGLLLTTNLHIFFDNYVFSIDTDVRHHSTLLLQLIILGQLQDRAFRQGYGRYQ